MTPNDGNFANIHGTNQGTYLLGGRDENNECTSVDFNDEKGEQEGFGRESVTVTVGYKRKWRILVMGGLMMQEQTEGDMVEGPTNALWMLDKEAEDKSLQWERRKLSRPMCRFGAVTLRNEWLILFGGYHVKMKAMRASEYQPKLEMSRQMYALRLKDGQWISLQKKLPRKAEYFAVYNEGAEVVHLYTYRGHHYTIEVKDLFEAVEEAQDTAASWEVDKSDSGKTVLPTKSKSITNMGPKLGDSDDEKEE